jgi:glycosyltransferase involved in cell wall biosynthesis
MRKRKVLVVGMVDSIHLARWLSQFEGSDIEFTVFPSKRFKFIHQKMLNLLRNDPRIDFAGGLGNYLLRYSGYFDFLFFELIKKDFRSGSLTKILKKTKFDYLHALEIQGAGYLAENALREINDKPKLILTNWGSDIFYFQSIPEHLKKIRSALKAADFYSAECVRDYRLAKLYGFTGEELPCIPNAGGFDESEFNLPKIKTSERNGIVVKSYGGRFGRGNLAIEAISDILPTNPKISVYFYSVTKDLEESVSKMKHAYPDRVDFSTLSRPLTHEKLREIFLNSRIYIGCSISDGISTSFLEALIYGAYPIQTDTSCANEWVEKGIKASLVSLDHQNLVTGIKFALNESQLIDTAMTINFNIAKHELNWNTIHSLASEFYI